MLRELPRQVGHFKFPLGFPKIPFANSVVMLVAAMFYRDGLAMHHLVGQILDRDFFAARHHHAPLQHILQLAYIARPIVFLDCRHRLALQPRRPPEPRRVHLQKSIRQQRDVLLVGPQRRQINGHHAQPVKQILTKLCVANLRQQIAVRRADHPHIHGN
jgi:hypothetical protein